MNKPCSGYRYRIVFVFLACCISALAAGQSGVLPVSDAWRETELDAAYNGWAEGPGAMRGFWYALDLADMQRRTGATAFSIHHGLPLEPAPAGPNHPKAQAMFESPRNQIALQFTASKPLFGVGILVSTGVSGASAEGRLLQVIEGGAPIEAAKGEIADALRQPWLVCQSAQPSPPGVYRIEITLKQERVEVWPVPVEDTATVLHDPAAQDEEPGVALQGWLLYADGSWTKWEGGALACRSLGALNDAAKADAYQMQFTMGLGEHNNPFFSMFPQWFQEAYPEAFMQDVKGEIIRSAFFDGTPGNPVPAMDAPILYQLSSDLIRRAGAHFKDTERLAYWVISGEECYPDYFGLPASDFRPQSRAHYNAYAQRQGWDWPLEPEACAADAPSRMRGAWMQFREEVESRRAAYYTQQHLNADPRKRFVFYPTHGNPFFAQSRRAMGFAPGGIAGACDGFETGQITIDEDADSLNMLTLSGFTAYGVPVVTPRLANKTLDPAVQGGGRSFTPWMLRRLVYECLGMGVFHIGMVQWEGDLPDGLWHIKDTPAEAEARAVFAEIATAQPILSGMGRVQPRIALYVSDATWRLAGWNPMWTAFIQDALRARWSITFIGDRLLSASLPERIPALISIENPYVSREALEGLRAYTAGGGKLYRWGALAEQDALYAPWSGQAQDVLAASQELDVQPESQERIVHHAVHTGSGAYTSDAVIKPLPIAAVEEALRREIPAYWMRPVDVQGEGGPLTVLPLTDGRTLAVVLINGGDSASRATLKTPSDADTPWRFTEISAGRLLEAAPDGSSVELRMPPRSTALVWGAPEVSAEVAQAELDGAAKALEQWRAAGVDTAFYAAQQEAALRAYSHGLYEKAYALAGKLVCGVGVKAGAFSGEKDETGVAMHLLDAQGQPVTDGRVQARITSGAYMWRLCRDEGEGKYSISLPAAERPVMYDVNTQAYKPMEGPVRLVIRVSRPGRIQSGALVYTVLPLANDPVPDTSPDDGNK